MKYRFDIAMVLVNEAGEIVGIQLKDSVDKRPLLLPIGEVEDPQKLFRRNRSSGSLQPYTQLEFKTSESADISWKVVHLSSQIAIDSEGDPTNALKEGVTLQIEVTYIQSLTPLPSDAKEEKQTVEYKLFLSEYQGVLLTTKGVRIQTPNHERVHACHIAGPRLFHIL